MLRQHCTKRLPDVASRAEDDLGIHQILLVEREQSRVVWRLLTSNQLEAVSWVKPDLVILEIQHCGEQPACGVKSILVRPLFGLGETLLVYFSTVTVFRKHLHEVPAVRLLQPHRN